MRSHQLIRRTPNNASAEYCGAAGRKAHRTGIKKKHSWGGGGGGGGRSGPGVYRGFSRQLNATTA